MKSKLVITDLTRMHRGMVCIAGYDLNHRCVRPVLPPPGIPERSLFQNGKLVIFPFSLIELDLLHSKVNPPHTEDWLYEPDSIQFSRIVNDRLAVLGWSLFESVQAIFEQPVLSDIGFSVLDCQGPRSLGTIKPENISNVIYAAGEDGNWDYRLVFIDQSGEQFCLKIVDLAWQYYCASLRSASHDHVKIAADLTVALQSSDVYLRIGLARGWQKFPERCFLQITGVYSFPDYLQGKAFADIITSSLEQQNR